MNSTTLENAYIPTLTKAADRVARMLIDRAHAGQSRKQLLVALSARIRSIRCHCLVCRTEWSPMQLGQEDARHICVVARRASFVSVRRRLEEHFRKAPLRCPACAARGTEGLAGDSAGLAESGARAHVDAAHGEVEHDKSVVSVS